MKKEPHTTWGATLWERLMTKAAMLIALLAILLLLSAVCLAAQPVSKYWQDVLRKPNQTWIELYGYNNESVLAFNVRSLLEVQESMARTIVSLQADVEALEKRFKELDAYPLKPEPDPNEVAE